MPWSPSTISRNGGATWRASSRVDAELRGDGLGDAVDLAVAVAHDTTDVSHGGARQHRAEGDDLGDVVLPVLAGHVVDDLVTTGVLEVDVDVRHRHAVGVEEALEGQLVGMGSTGVMPSVYVTIEPGAEPRQVVAMPCSRAKRVKSATMRK